MRFLWRNAIFILFPAVVVAIIFLAQISFQTSERFGRWGERSVADSTLLVTKEKIDRVEEVIGAANDTAFGIVDPSRLGEACERWRASTASLWLIEAAVILDDFGDITAFYHRCPDEKKAADLKKMIAAKVAPLVDKYESLDQYKHLHIRIGEGYRLITHLTTMYEGADYTTCLIYNTNELVEGLFRMLLENVGEDRVANVVDDRNLIVFGKSIDEADQFIVARGFPSTLYKWRLQLAPTSSAVFSSQAQAKAKRFSELMLFPLALGVIALGLIVLYLSVVRERRLSRLKSDFIANISHELKTPLSLIRMFGELLVMGKSRDESKTKQYSEIILRETERLGALIDNVLNLAKIERGKSGYEFHVLNPKEAVDRGVEVFQDRIVDADFKVVYTAEPNLPKAKIDEHAITLAVVNLIDNAVKYARGTDVIGVELSAKNGFICLDVYDHGSGIPESHLKRIFERFYRVPSNETRKQRGSGIGLSLVKHIVEGHGGGISVTSTPYGETRFSIQIPVENGGHKELLR